MNADGEDFCLSRHCSVDDPPTESKLFKPNLLSFAGLLFVKPLHGWWPTYWANTADVQSAFLKFAHWRKSRGSANRTLYCLQFAVTTLALHCSIKVAKWIARSSIAVHKVTKWMTSFCSGIARRLYNVDCMDFPMTNFSIASDVYLSSSPRQQDTQV